MDWEIQSKAVQRRLNTSKDIEITKEFIESQASKYLSYPYSCSAMYTSTRDYDIRTGFLLWELRIYAKEGYWYDLIMDRITEDNLEHYVKHAVQTITDENKRLGIECE